MRLSPLLLLLLPVAAGVGCSLIVSTGGDGGACLEGKCAPGFTCVKDRCVASSSTRADAGTLPVEQCPQPCGPAQACFAGSCVPAGTVQGSRMIVYWPDQGALPPQPADGLTETEIGVLVPKPNGYASYPGTFQPDGTFTIPNVPRGSRFLRVAGAKSAPTLVETSESSVDLGEDQAGRPGVTSANSETPVTLRLSGLVPLEQAGTTPLQAFSSNAGVFVLDEPALSPGASYLEWTYDWSSSAYGLLPDGAFGDVTYVQQLKETDYGQYQVRNVVAWGQLPPGFVVNAGRSQAWDAPLQPAAQSGSLYADWRVGEFAQQLPEVNPRAERVLHLAYLDANAHRPDLWPPSGAPDLLSLSASFDPPSSAPSSLMVGPLTYGRYLPPLWKEFLAFMMQASVPFTAPGANTETKVSAVSLTYRDAPAAWEILSPQIGPVRSATVAGLTGFDPRPGVGTTPAIAWMAPALGQPTSYQLTLFELLANPADQTSVLKTALVVALAPTTTSFRVPPGILSLGKTYVARISAVAQPGDTYATAPFRGAFPYSSADCVLGPLSP